MRFDPKTPLTTAARQLEVAAGLHEDGLHGPGDGQRQEDVLDVGPEGVGHRHARLPLPRHAHAAEDVREAGARGGHGEAQHVPITRDVRRESELVRMKEIGSFRASSSDFPFKTP